MENQTLLSNRLSIFSPSLIWPEWSLDEKYDANYLVFCVWLLAVQGEVYPLNKVFIAVLPLATN